MNNLELYDKNCIVPDGHVDRYKQPEEWLKRKIDWITFYRRNVHRFIEHYLGVRLHPYQIVWIYDMSQCEYFVTIASRATAKSWLVALYAIAIAILYPHSEIVVASTIQKQAGKLMNKISKFRNEYPMIYREISKYANTANERVCNFHNASTITVVACKDGGRGERATLTIGEEFVGMDKVKYDSVVRQFAYARQAGYSTLPEWSFLPPEEPREILISSAYHKGLWWYTETVGCIKKMLAGKSAGFIAFDYSVAIEHKIKTIKQIAKDKSDMDMIAFQEECCNIPWGENSDAYFKLIMFERTQNITKAFYPQRNDNYNPKKNPYGLKKVEGELRVVSADIAIMGGRINDNTILSCTRLIPTQADGYLREVCYMESHSGENSITQAFRIKQLFYDFEADYLVLDKGGSSGMGIYDELGTLTKDNDRGIEYPAWTIMYTEDQDKYEELHNRTIASNAKDIIYLVNAGSKLNDAIATAMRDKLQKKMINFLISEMDAEPYLIKNFPKEYTKLNDEVSEKGWFLHPYVQTSAFVNECVSLSMSLLDGYIKLKEPSGGRKDRYTSVSYMNYFVSKILDPRIRKEETMESVDEFVKAVFW